MKPYLKIYSDITTKNICTIEGREYYIIVTRNCFDIDIVGSGKMLYLKRDTPNVPNKIPKPTIPVYKIDCMKKCHSKDKKYPTLL